MATPPSGRLERLKAFIKDPVASLAEAAEQGGAAREIALATQPLWLTPSRYKALPYTGRPIQILICMVVAAGLWTSASGVLFPMIKPPVAAAVAKLGQHLGYWDPAFTDGAARFLLVAATMVILALATLMDWAGTWMGAGVERLCGRRGISPPPLGYVATTFAGRIVALSAITAALGFATWPLNAPVWQWLAEPGLLQGGIVLASAALIFSVNWISVRAHQVRMREIYGSPLKAVGCMLLGCGLCGGLMAVLFESI